MYTYLSKIPTQLKKPTKKSNEVTKRSVNLHKKKWAVMVIATVYCIYPL